jgi:hypothetical protein
MPGGGNSQGGSIKVIHFIIKIMGMSPKASFENRFRSNLRGYYYTPVYTGSIQLTDITTLCL